VPLDDIERAPGLRGERPEHRWFREERHPRVTGPRGALP